jgi:hypothetical protein
MGREAGLPRRRQRMPHATQCFHAHRSSHNELSDPSISGSKNLVLRQTPEFPSVASSDPCHSQAPIRQNL